MDKLTIKMLTTVVVEKQKYESGEFYQVEPSVVEGLTEGEEYELAEKRAVAEKEIEKAYEAARKERIEDMTLACTQAISEITKKQSDKKAPAILSYGRGTDEFQESFSFHRALKAIHEFRQGRTGIWDQYPREKESMVSAAELKTTVAETSDALGGYWVAPEHSQELFDLLYAENVVLSAGVPVMPMQSDTLDMGGLATGINVYRLGETTINASGITEGAIAMGQRKLVAKPLVALLPLSDIFLQDANPQSEAFIKQHIAKNMAIQQDQDYIRGSGVGSTPLGFVNACTTNTGTVAVASITFDTLHDARYNIENANSRVTAWITHPYVTNGLRKLTDSTGRYLWQEAPRLGEPATLQGLPVYVSTNCWDGTSSYYLICGDFQREARIGMRQQIQIDVDKSFLFNALETCVRAVLRDDIVMIHENAFHIQTVT